MDTHEKALTIGIFLLVIAILFFVFIFVANSMSTQVDFILMNKNCCAEGYVCSDTYYTEEDNVCHLVLCEHSIIGNNCTYPGRNITQLNST